MRGILAFIVAVALLSVAIIAPLFVIGSIIGHVYR